MTIRVDKGKGVPNLKDLVSISVYDDDVEVGDNGLDYWLKSKKRRKKIIN